MLINSNLETQEQEETCKKVIAFLKTYYDGGFDFDGLHTTVKNIASPLLTISGMRSVATTQRPLNKKDNILDIIKDFSRVGLLEWQVGKVRDDLKTEYDPDNNKTFAYTFITATKAETNLENFDVDVRILNMEYDNKKITKTSGYMELSVNIDFDPTVFDNSITQKVKKC